jgi:hypothetical protein
MDLSDREIAPFEEERAGIVKVLRALYGPDAESGYAELRLRPGHPGVQVPLSVIELLASACNQMQFGAAVRLHRLPPELTIEEAESFLGIVSDALRAGVASGDVVSRPTTENQIAREDALQLIRRRHGGRTAGLRELATDSDA